MKLENQVCTLEQAKRLKELLGEFYGLFVYMENKALPSDSKIMLSKQTESFKQMGKIEGSAWIKYHPAFTVAELGVMLPHFDNLAQMGGFVHLTEFDPSGQDGKPFYCVWEYDKDKEGAGFGREIIDGETEAQARAAMLIYCLERQLTTPEEVNNRLLNA